MRGLGRSSNLGLSPIREPVGYCLFWAWLRPVPRWWPLDRFTVPTFRKRYVKISLNEFVCLIGVLTIALASGCSAPAPRTGYLSNYDNLERIDKDIARYVSPELGEYSTFLVDPIEVRVQKEPPVLDDEQREDVIAFFRENLILAFEERGLTVTDAPEEGVARIRLAITDIRKGTWWLNVHPISKLSGAGIGGAAMEAEIVDSDSGIQLAAMVQRGWGNRFEIDTFNELDDVKDVLQDWSVEIARRVDIAREAMADSIESPEVQVIEAEQSN